NKAISLLEEAKTVSNEENKPQASLIENSKWPIAVNPEIICATEEDKIDRAEGIIEIFITEKLQDKKFLDFGCGEGRVVEAAAKNGAKLAIGYDTNYHKDWEDRSGNIHLTSDPDFVKENGPYDIVLL